MQRRARSTSGFSLVELLVAIGIIGILIAILLPVLAKVRTASRRAMCLSNLHQLGIAIHAYSVDNNGCIPYGPKAPPFTATNFYPTTGAVTSLISLENGAPVGMGLMLVNHLSKVKNILFCPDVDQERWGDIELAKVGKAQAQCDYYYRHGSGSSIYVDSGTEHLKLSGLGKNSDGVPIRALALDVNYLVDGGVAVFGVNLRTSHRMETVNILYSDGHVSAVSNKAGEYTVDARDNPRLSYAKILKVFELADRMQ